MVGVSIPTFEIRPAIDSDWREVRELRLEMIRDTPLAFAESLEDALAHGEAEWRLRARRGPGDHGIAVVAISDSGRWVGTMGGFVPDPITGPLLVGVFVTPEVRGARAGVTDALLARIEEWARAEGGRLTLHVHEENIRARTAYKRRGFLATDRTFPYALYPLQKKWEMVKELR